MTIKVNNDLLRKTITENNKSKIIWFLRTGSKTYTEILNHLNERDSGKVNYHLKSLLLKKIIIKKLGKYCLTKQGLSYSIYVDSLKLKEKYPIPVCLVIIFKDNKLLIARRSREPFKGYWGLPGNEILYMDSAIKTAKKEVNLELGFKTKKSSILGFYPTIYKK